MYIGYLLCWFALPLYRSGVKIKLVVGRLRVRGHGTGMNNVAITVGATSREGFPVLFSSNINDMSLIVK